MTKEEKKVYNKQYYLTHKDTFQKQAKQYYKDNRDKLLNYSKQYQANNKEKINQYSKQYRANNKEKINQYKINNKEHLNNYQKQYYIQHRKIARIKQTIEVLKNQLENDNTSGYTVYIHKNKINGKCYIGKTKQEPKKRWRSGDGYKRCKYFYNDIQKYGWDNFEHIILNYNISKTMASILEKQYILRYNTLDKENGYNIKVG